MAEAQGVSLFFAYAVIKGEVRIFSIQIAAVFYFYCTSAAVPSHNFFCAPSLSQPPGQQKAALARSSAAHNPMMSDQETSGAKRHRLGTFHDRMQIRAQCSL